MLLSSASGPRLHGRRNSNAMPNMIDTTSLYPYLVPETYEQLAGAASGFYRPIGGGIVAAVVRELPNSVASLSPRDLDEMAQDEDAVWEIAMHNLHRELSEGRIVVQTIDFPGGGQGLLIGPHWVAASVLLHTGAYPWFEEALGSSDLAAVVANREALFLYSRSADPEVLRGADIFEREALANVVKPLGPVRFALNGDGPEALL